MLLIMLLSNDSDLKSKALKFERTDSLRRGRMKGACRLLFIHMLNASISIQYTANGRQVYKGRDHRMI